MSAPPLNEEDTDSLLRVHSSTTSHIRRRNFSTKPAVSLLRLIAAEKQSSVGTANQARSGNIQQKAAIMRKTGAAMQTQQQSTKRAFALPSAILDIVKRPASRPAPIGGIRTGATIGATQPNRLTCTDDYVRNNWQSISQSTIDNMIDICIRENGCECFVVDKAQIQPPEYGAVYSGVF